MVNARNEPTNVPPTDVRYELDEFARTGWLGEAGGQGPAAQRREGGPERRKLPAVKQLIRSTGGKE
jgi:hypothetical protein